MGTGASDAPATDDRGVPGSAGEALPPPPFDVRTSDIAEGAE